MMSAVHCKHCFSVRDVTPTQTSPAIALFPTMEDFTGMEELDLPTVLLEAVVWLSHHSNQTSTLDFKTVQTEPRVPNASH